MDRVVGSQRWGTLAVVGVLITFGGLALVPGGAVAKERSGRKPAVGQGPDELFLNLEQGNLNQGKTAPPPAAGEAVGAAVSENWGKWAPLFAPAAQITSEVRGLGAANLADIHAQRVERVPLSPAQALFLDKLRSLLTPYKALVVSGGVSLGAYQAGFLYYTTLALRRFDEGLRARGWRGPDVGRFRVATGASAGSINAFLSAIAGCRTATATPEDSPYWRAWVEIGLDELRAHPSTHNAVFDRRALEKPVSDALQMLASPAGWRGEPCDAVLGLTATRLEPRPVKIRDPDALRDRSVADVTLARQSEKFLLEMEVSPALGRPQFSSYRLAWEKTNALISTVYPTLGFAPRAAAAPDDLPVDAADVAVLLQASAAFPLAFPPVAVPLTLWERAPNGFSRALQRPLFNDGGLLDNTPLRLAQKLLLSEGCAPDDGADVDPRGATILFSKSDTEGWRRPSAPLTLEEEARANEEVVKSKGPHEKKTVLAELGAFAMKFITNATDLEAMEALEVMATDEAFDRPNGGGAAARTAPPPADQRACRQRRRVVSPEIPARGMPIAGQFLMHFGAFLEKDFRVFDFYQGVLDAREHVEKHLLINPALSPLTSPTFACFRAFRDLTDAQDRTADPPVVPAICDGLPLNLRALLVASARVRQRTWQDARVDEFRVFLESLRTEGFRYTSLAHDQTLDYDEVQNRLRDKLQEALHQLGRAQGPVFSPGVLAVSVGAKVGADVYRHRSPTFVAAGFSNGLELSAGLLPDSWRSASGRFALKVMPSFRWGSPSRFWGTDGSGRLSTQQSVRTISLGAAAELRLEVDLRPAVTPLQLEVGLGWEGRSRTRALAGFIPRATWVSYRHGPLASLSAILAQRIYLTVAGVWWIDKPCGVEDIGGSCAGVNPRFQRYEPIETTQLDFRLSAGWRSMW